MDWLQQIPKYILQIPGLTFVLKNTWLFLPIFGFSVFLSIYFWADKLFTFLFQKSLTKQNDIMKYMKLLGMEVDQKKVTTLLLASSFGIGFVVFLMALPDFSIGIVMGISFGIMGFQLPPLIFKSLYEKRCNAFVDQMVDALTILANGVKAGSNPQQAMQRVVEIMGQPVSSEFQQVITQTQFGQSFEEALNDLGERIPRQDVQMFVVAINILKETGGNLSETFQTIVGTIRERQKLEKKISAMTAQGIMQGIIVTSIPFVLGVVFFFLDPERIMIMFNTTSGWIMLAIILALQVIGGVMIKKIVTIKV